MPYTGGLCEQPYGVILRFEKVKLADQLVEEAEEQTTANKAAAEKRLEERLGSTSA
jgi:hypothetical protein